MKRINFTVLIFGLCLMAHAKGQEVTGTSSKSGAAKIYMITSPESERIQKHCAEFAGEEAAMNSKKIGDCREWYALSQDANRERAIKSCGGSNAESRDPGRFNTCVDLEQHRLNARTLGAQEKCGGYAASVADSGKFSRCFAAALKK